MNAKFTRLLLTNPLAYFPAWRTPNTPFYLMNNAGGYLTSLTGPSLKHFTYQINNNFAW